MSGEKLLVRLSGRAAEVFLNELVRRGYFATKSEAISARVERVKNVC